MFKTLSKPIYCAAISLFTLTMGTTALAQDYKVELNKTQVLRLPSPASAVVIGNPEIADVSVHSQDTIFLVGRSYGETNLTILDAHGQVIINSNVIVGQTLSANGVRLYKMGEGRQTYSCAPQCLPAPILGDSPVFKAENATMARPISNVSAGPAPAPASGFSMPNMAPGQMGPMQMGPGAMNSRPRNSYGDDN